MKNKWMKALALLLGVGGVMVGLAGCEKEERVPEPKKYPVYTKVGLPARFGNIESFGQSSVEFPVEGAAVYLFEKELDYLLRQNPIEVNYTNELGLVEFWMPDTSKLWMWVEKGELTSARNAMPESHIGSMLYSAPPIVTYEHVSSGASHKEVSLTVAPASLQINVLHNGQAVADAQVQLYFSKAAYDQDLPAQEDFEQLAATYGYPGADNIEGFISAFDMFFLLKTNEDGSAYFPNLEPKRYWFKVIKDGLTNSSGTISIEEPLDNTSEATKVITVGIN